MACPDLLFLRYLVARGVLFVYPRASNDHCHTVCQLGLNVSHLFDYFILFTVGILIVNY